MAAARVVVFVDAEPASDAPLVQALEHAGFAVEAARDAVQAMELLRSGTVDATVLATQTLEPSVVTLARDIKQDPRGCALPLIVLAGECSAQARLQLLQAGAEEVLTRPIEPQELIVRLQNLILLGAAGAGRVERTLAATVQQHDRSSEQTFEVRKMEAIGRLAGGVAHDFNNLLTSIICFTRFVADDLSEEDPRRQDLGEVLRAADSAARLTNQLLAFSRRKPVAPGALGVNLALGSVDRLLRRTLGEEIELVMVPSDEALTVFMDPGHFDQLILNLILNARDAMPSGGTATLGVGKTVGSTDVGLTDGEYVVLTVTDTGIGMSPDIAEQVFDPFFTTKGDKGSGLGLATCYAIVREAGGRITVETEEGKGSTFKIFLPSVDENQLADPRRSASIPPYAFTGTVLIVEDQPMLSRTIARTLSRAGFKIEQTRSAEDALAMFASRSDRLDLLVADVVLPGMSGVHLAERMREREPELPVLFVSGYSPESADADMHLDARTGFLAKPFNNKQLLLRTAALLAPVATKVT